MEPSADWKNISDTPWSSDIVFFADTGPPDRGHLPLDTIACAQIYVHIYMCIDTHTRSVWPKSMLVSSMELCFFADAGPLVQYRLILDAVAGALISLHAPRTKYNPGQITRPAAGGFSALGGRPEAEAGRSQHSASDEPASGASPPAARGPSPP